MSKVLVVVANFYPDISNNLERPVLTALKKARMEPHKIYVPGTFEIPNAMNIALESVDYAGVIALGCVIKGETAHFDVVVNESARALQDIAIYYSVPMGYGIISANNKKQAEKRAAEYGKGAVNACLELIKIKESYANYYDQDISLFN
jgi:6,7-dimethyl-8-ribityllumazine synthase